MRLIFIFIIGLVYFHGFSQSFNATQLSGENLINPTSLDFGPDGRLYVAQQDGTILAYTISRDGGAPGNGNYSVDATEIINQVKNGVPNHDDDGSANTTLKRQITGLRLSGSSDFPIIYVSSSDWRIGGAGAGTDKNLDTNSGVLSRLTWNGSSWEKVDLIRGLPRCEENHSTNGMVLHQMGATTYLFLQQGGNTNMGAPSNNFAGTSETYLSGALLRIDLTALENMPVYTDSRNGAKFIYDLPTLNDPTKSQISNGHPEFPYPPGHPLYNASIDLGDPFGGNDGLNQAILEPNSPVTIFAPGFRNAYDLVISEAGLIYTIDNGPNVNWGGKPLIYDAGGNVKSDQSQYTPAAGDYVTNDFNEGNTATIGDALHVVGAVSDSPSTYYGGHPVPIRAFPDKAGVQSYVYNNGSWSLTASYQFNTLLDGVQGYFNSSLSIADFPQDSRQGSYLVGNESASEVNILDVVPHSTNGMTIYTASNFDSAITGHVLAVSHDGQVIKYEFSADGQSLVGGRQTLFSGFGSIPLDIISRGDTDSYPGTVWVANYDSDGISIFEPADFVSCLQPGDTGYEESADYDNDGYSNQDEIDNGTDHCSGGSRPKDADGDDISDLNDPDDDNDGISDSQDYFALDPENGLNTTLPISYPFWSNDPGTGLFGLGFTGLMVDPSGTTDYLDLFEDTNLTFGGAGGKATIDIVGQGSAIGQSNSQENAFLFGIAVNNSSPTFHIHTRLEMPFTGNEAQQGQFQGLFIGNGDQDNFFLISVDQGTVAGDGMNGISLLSEENGTGTPVLFDIPGLTDSNSIDLYLEVSPGSEVVQAYYSLNGGATIDPLGNPQSLPYSFLDANDANGLAVGIMASRGTSAGFAATWDFINIVEGAIVTNDLLAINAGGETVTQEGIQYESDNYFNGGKSFTNLNAQVPALYQTERSSATKEFSYQIPVSDTELQVSLEFAEIFWGANGGGPGGIGKRVFDVTIEGVKVLDDFDIYDEVGAEVPLSKTFAVTVTDGILDIYFSALHSDGGIDEPKVSAIRLNYDNSGSEADPLTIAPISDINSYSGDEIDLSVVASGGDPAENFTYSISGQPAGIAIEPTNGHIYGILPPEAFQGGINSNGDYQVQVYVNKPGSQQAMESFSWRVDRGWFSLDENENYIARHECSFLQAGEKFYLLGGRESNQVEMYDYKTDTWTIGGNPMPVNLNHFQGVVFEGLIWVIGAIQGDNYPNDTPAAHVWIYDPINDEWIQGPEIPEGRRRGASALAEHEGKFYLVGGNTNGHDGGYVSWTDRFDPVTGTWETLNDMPHARDHFNVIVYNDKLYAIGGRQSGGPGGVFQPLVPEIDVFDFNSESWTTLAPGANIPTPRAGPVTALYKDKILVLGGSVEEQEVYGSLTTDVLQITEQFDPISQNWTRVDDGNFKRRATQAIASGEGLYTLAGSNTLLGGRQKNLEYYGLNQPTGDPLLPGNLGYPESVNFNAPGAIDLTLLEDTGNSGIFIRDMYLTGVNAAEFSLHDVPEGNFLLRSSGQLDFQVSFEGTTPSAQASLIVDYGAQQQISIPIVGPASISNEWTLLQENTNYTARHECSFVQAGDQFYLFGGRESPRNVDVYDYSLDQWETLTDSAPRDFNHLQAVEYQGLIWVLGGFRTNSFPDELAQEYVWIFDPTNSQWYQGPEIPVSRRRGSAGLVVYENKFYLIGGNTNGHNSGSVAWVDRFDPLSGSWESLNDAPRPRDHFQATLIGDKIFLAGGRLTGGTGGYFKPLIPEVDVLDLSTMQWSTLPQAANLPTPRGGSAAVNFQGKLVVIGGEVENESVYGQTVNDALKITEQLDPVTNSWERLEDLNAERHGTQAIVSGPGVIITSGSPNKGGGNQKNMEYLGHFQPVGNSLEVASLTGPANFQLTDQENANLELQSSGGNSVGGWITTIDITGANADNFNVLSPSTLPLLVPSGQNIGVEMTYDGSSESAQANLEITYSGGQTLSIPLIGTQVQSDGVISYTLVDAGSDTDLYNLNEGMTIDPASIQGKSLAVRANTNPTVVGSVYLQISGPINYTRNENVEPYALFGNIGSDYTGRVFTEGSYTITASAFSGSNQSGAPIGEPFPLNFSVQAPQPSNESPVANALATPSSGEVPLIVSFDGTSSTDDKEVASYLWQFNDGSGATSSAAQVTHTFNQAGTFYPTLTVSDAEGLEDTISLTILVEEASPGNQPPIASGTASPDNGAAPLPVAFDGTGSTDDQGIESYLWEFHDGSGSTASTEQADHTYDSPGIYYPTLTVTDAEGLQDTITLTVVVEESTPGNEAPVAVATANPESGTVPLTVNFDGSNSIDDKEIVSYAWDFNDGSGATSTQVQPVYQYDNPGTYYPILTVTDAEGLTDTTSLVITVSSESPTEGVVGATLMNADSDSELFALTDGMQIESSSIAGINLAIRADTEPIKVGSVSLTINGPLNSSRTENVEPYALFGNIGNDYSGQQFPEGDYQFTASAYNDSGLSGGMIGEEFSISFSVVSSTQENQPPNAIAVADPLSGNVPLTVQFDASASTDDGTIVSYLWEFKDGTSSTSTDTSPQYIFNNEGTFMVQLTVTDNDGLEGSDFVNIQVSSAQNDPPVVTNPGNQINEEGDYVELQVLATDSDPISFTATNLPPNLSIDTQSGLISGTLATGGSGTGAYEESDGLLIVEAEAEGVIPQWSITTLGNSTGIIGGSNHFNDQNGGIISYPIEINIPGVYRFNWRSFYSGPDGTEENDSWLKLPNSSDVWFFGYKGTSLNETQMINKLEGGNYQGIVFPKGSSRVTSGTTPSGSGGNGFFKIYRSGGSSQVYDWQARTSDNDSHNIYVWFKNAGTYTVQIGERSLGHAIDRFALYKLDGPAYSDQDLTNAAPSGSTAAPGASANSPYAVTVSVMDSGNNASDVQFSWEVTEPQQNQTLFNSYMFVNANTDSDLFELTNGMQINESLIQGIDLSIRATPPSSVGSMAMSITGPVAGSRTENVAPYALFGDSSGNYFGQLFPTGSYTLTATAYSGSNKSGTILGSDTVNFTISGNSGKTSYSPEVISESQIPISISIYPNPTSEQAHVSMDENLPGLKKVEFYDTAGRLILQKRMTRNQSSLREVELQIPGLESGVYHLRLYASDGSIYHRSLIIR